MNDEFSETAPDRAVAEVGARLRSARSKAGLTRKQVATASGASERYLAHLEAGTGNPSVEMLLAIAGALHVAVADLLPQGGERSKERALAANILRRLPRDRLDAVIDWMQKPAMPSSGKANRIALVGLRGAGKSSLGSALAARLHMPFFEISKEVERTYGGAVSLLIELNGQSALRRYEAEVLEVLCRENAAAIIAAPGGIVADGPLYDTLLASTHTIWLEARPEDHMSRVVAQGDLRPMSGARGAMEDLKSILAARSADYGRADATLDTSKQNFERTVDRLESIAHALIT
jgi:XRE family transcriptional regulator, aerobic/anaerobic benzoate catabolism transcriptional regulator